MGSCFIFKCKESGYVSVQMRVNHLDTQNQTWQKWNLCKKHFFRFLQLNEGWGFYKRKKDDHPKAVVIGFRLPHLVYNNNEMEFCEQKEAIKSL